MREGRIVKEISKVFVAGGSTLIGSALVDWLQESGFEKIYGFATEPDLTNAQAVDAFFAATRPEYVFLAAGLSGGIAENLRSPADLMRNNLLVECHVLESAYRHQAKKLVYLASSCSYPRLCPQPMREDALLTAPLEPTNEAYAVAKIAGIKLCQAYRQQFGANFVSVIPANAFGPGDDFSREKSHVIGALIRKMHDAKVDGAAHVELWGSGKPTREFIFVRDLADACVFVMRHYDGSDPINLGTGIEFTIHDLAAMIGETVGYTGRLTFDISKPDGMPRKALDSTKLRGLGWRPRFGFRDALSETYGWFVRHECGKELMHA
jgi:GDP-L-fucose synthase